MPVEVSKQTLRKISEQIDCRLGKIQTLGEQVIAGRERPEAIKVYSAGLKAKIRQARFALHTLTEIASNINAYAAIVAKGELTGGKPNEFGTLQDFNDSDRMHFYCDSFWAFLYSGLDILGQITNQVLKLGLDESKVDFKGVFKHIKGECPHKHSILLEQLRQCRVSHAFKNLDKYRHCSTHRRQICLQRKEESVVLSEGYTFTDRPPKQRQWLLCDNPSVMKTRMSESDFAQGRKIPEYMADALERMLVRISKILQQLKPVA